METATLNQFFSSWKVIVKFQWSLEGWEDFKTPTFKDNTKSQLTMSLMTWSLLLRPPSLLTSSICSRLEVNHLVLVTSAPASLSRMNSLSTRSTSSSSSPLSSPGMLLNTFTCKWRLKITWFVISCYLGAVTEIGTGLSVFPGLFIHRDPRGLIQ